MKKLIFALIVSLIGSYFIWTHANPYVFFGIFLLIWGNNINIAHTLAKENT